MKENEQPPAPVRRYFYHTIHADTFSFRKSKAKPIRFKTKKTIRGSGSKAVDQKRRQSKPRAKRPSQFRRNTNNDESKHQL